MISSENLREEKKRILALTGGGISLTVAGGIYWLVAGIFGLFLSEGAWVFSVAFASGLIFPLGLLLEKPLGSKLIPDNAPLAALAGFAVLSINLLWPVHIAIIIVAPELLPLSLAIGMGLHWPIIGWMYDSRACLTHALVRVFAASAIWYFLPDQRFTLLPFILALIYAMTTVWLRSEAKAAQQAARTTAVTAPT